MQLYKEIYDTISGIGTLCQEPYIYNGTINYYNPQIGRFYVKLNASNVEPFDYNAMTILDDETYRNMSRGSIRKHRAPKRKYNFLIYKRVLDGNKE